MSRHMGTLRLCLLGLVSALSFLLAEYLFRQIQRSQWTSAIAEIEHPFLEHVPDSPIVYRLKRSCALQPTIPQADGTHLSWQLETDTQGFRKAAAKTTTVTEGAETLLFLGDSYTFGYAVAAEEAFPFLVATEIAISRPPVLTINAGVPGYNSVQELEYLRELLDRFEVDRVLLSYVINDAEPAPNFPLHPDTRFRHCNSWIWERSKPAINVLAKAVVGDRELFERKEVMPNPDPLDGFAPERREWYDSRAAIDEMAALCADRQIPFHLVILPSFIMTLDDSYPYTLIHERVMSWGKELGVPTLDLLALFHGLDVREHSVPGDGHPNAAAHRMIAAAIRRHLAEAR